MKWRPFILAVAACFAWLPVTAPAAECAAPGSDGTGPGGGIVNTYWPGLGSNGSGSVSLSLGPARGAATTIQPGDLVLLVQMQDARINRSNSANYGGNDGTGSGYTNAADSGRFEFARATSSVGAGGGTLTLAAGTQFAYQTRAAQGTSGQRAFQVVRVPQYLTQSVGGTITAAAWNGSTGGIVALDVADALTFAGGAIDVSGAGFRGGGGRASTTGSGSNTDFRTPSSNLANGSKGEGIAGTPRFVFNNGGVLDNGTEGYPNGSFARGAPANAGGGGTDGRPSNNDQNTGGGGGGGYGDGGGGGHAWCPGGPAVCPQTGGRGGSGVDIQGVARLAMGGGGGAGTTNNATGTPGGGIATSGANGGGLIFVRAGRLAGSGQILANGSAGNQTVGNDGSGGGGGGGSILLAAGENALTSLSLSAGGGLGGSNNNSTPHGPGGGGGGGFIATNAVLAGLAGNVSGGAPGDTDGNPAPFTPAYGATNGAPGLRTTVDPTAVPGLSPGYQCRLDLDKDITPDVATVGTVTRLTVAVGNPNPTLPMANISFTDTYPAGLVNAPAPNAANTCGGSLTATPGAGSLTLSGASLTANASCSIGVDVVGTSSGVLTNQIPINDAAATINGRPVTNLVLTETTLTAIEPLRVTKISAVISDPINNDVDPYAIPGAVTEYQIEIANQSAVAIDAAGIVLTDFIPANTRFVNDPITSGLPVVLDDGSPSSTLTLNAGDLTYSDDNGTTYTYAPSGSIDANVDAIRVQPTGSMAPNSSATIRFRVAID